MTIHVIRQKSVSDNLETSRFFSNKSVAFAHGSIEAKTPLEDQGYLNPGVGFSDKLLRYLQQLHELLPDISSQTPSTGGIHVNRGADQDFNIYFKKEIIKSNVVRDAMQYGVVSPTTWGFGLENEEGSATGSGCSIGQIAIKRKSGHSELDLKNFIILDDAHASLAYGEPAIEDEVESTIEKEASASIGAGNAARVIDGGLRLKAGVRLRMFMPDQTNFLEIRINFRKFKKIDDTDDLFCQLTDATSPIEGVVFKNKKGEPSYFFTSLVESVEFEWSGKKKEEPGGVTITGKNDRQLLFHGRPKRQKDKFKVNGSFIYIPGIGLISLGETLLSLHSINFTLCRIIYESPVIESQNDNAAIVAQRMRQIFTPGDKSPGGGLRLEDIWLQTDLPELIIGSVSHNGLKPKKGLGSPTGG